MIYVTVIRKLVNQVVVNYLFPLVEMTRSASLYFSVREFVFGSGVGSMQSVPATMPNPH